MGSVSKTLSNEADWSQWFYAGVTIATAFLLHLAVGYRPLPSIDDFAYLPVFRHAANPSLYTSDRLLQDMSLHSLGWYWIFTLSQATIGVARGFWLVTMGLAIATVTATFRIARTLGAGPLLMPMLGLLAFASSLKGIGRGSYDGAFGAAFHGQWLALCFMLFAYDSFMRRHTLRTGIFLGLTALGHMSVAIHGGIVIAFATLLSPGPRIKPLATIALVSIIVGAPALTPLLSHLARTHASDWSTIRLIEDGYMFRLPHEYKIGLERVGDLALLLIALAGVAGMLIIRQAGETPALRRLIALIVGHLFLLALALLFYVFFPHALLLPYLLALTRTSPLLLVLFCSVAVAGFDIFLRTPDRDVPFHLLAGVALGLAIALALRLFVQWNAPAFGLLGFASLLALRHGTTRGAFFRSTPLFVLTAVIASVAVAASLRNDKIELTPPPEAAQLYAWSRRSTAPDALFIIPPGMEAFRWYAERSVYVDFKMFPPASIDAIATWRQRLEDVASPDRSALAMKGWQAARQFDRCYAARNTPARIESLLSRTGASFFVWDADGLRIPPLTGSDRSPVPGLQEVFRNSRFTVYRLRQESGDA